MVHVLSDSAVQDALKNLPGWTIQDGKLFAEFKFQDFSIAFGFMIQVARIAEVMDHHPSWSNNYNVVRIALTTHDVGGISDADIEFARRVAQLKLTE